MVAYFITAIDPKAWQDPNSVPRPTSELFIDPVLYGQELREHWPDANVHASSDALMLLNWTLYGTGMEGEIHRDHQSITLRAGAGFVQFVLWHRTHVPSKFSLYLFSDYSWDTLELLETINERDIVRFLGLNV